MTRGGGRGREDERLGGRRIAVKCRRPACLSRLFGYLSIVRRACLNPPPLILLDCVSEISPAATPGFQLLIPFIVLFAFPHFSASVAPNSESLELDLTPFVCGK